MDLSRFIESHSATRQFAANMASAIQQVVAGIREELFANPSSLELEESEVSGKSLLKIDKTAEELGEILIREALTRKLIDEVPFCRDEELEYVGEESISTSSDFSDCVGDSVVVLVDMIDGTDLLERGLQNWCSAAIVFSPARNQILGAFVGTEGLVPGFGRVHENDGVRTVFAYDFVYFAHTSINPDEPSRKWSDLFDHSPIHVRAKREFYKKSAEGASIAFYGQKQTNLFSLGGNVEFLRLVGDKARLYNLAGIPMMMRMIDPLPGARRGIDAIIDVPGQKPHDAVPGLYIAMKAGATAIALRTIAHCGIEEGKPLNETMLAKLLLKPEPECKKDRVAYVVAPEAALANELAELLLKYPVDLTNFKDRASESAPPSIV